MYEAQARPELSGALISLSYQQRSYFYSILSKTGRDQCSSPQPSPTAGKLYEW